MAPRGLSASGGGRGGAGLAREQAAARRSWYHCPGPMIVSCPACRAELELPSTRALPPAGLGVSCSRCGRGFTARPPQEEEETPLALLAVQAPHEEETQALDEAPLLERARSGGHARPARELPVPGPDEEGLDPELDDTRRFDLEPPPEPGTQPGRLDLYAQLAAGTYVPEPSRPRGAPMERAQAHLEPPTAPGPLGALQRLAVLLNTAPLALRVLLVLLPLGFGALLVAVAGARGRRPAVQAAAEPSAAGAELLPVRGARGAAAEDRVPPPTGRAASGASASPEPPGFGSGGAGEDHPPEAPQHGAEQDEPADGLGRGGGAAAHAFIGDGGARLSARAGGEGAAVASLPAGQRVRRLEAVGASVLILVEPAGPVGFVPEAALGAEPPLGALADAVAFSGCATAGGVTFDDCLANARASELDCLDRCEPDGAEGSERCAEACALAFERCAKRCKRTSIEAARTPRRRR